MSSSASPGMTLLEVMIAMAIFSFVTVIAFQTTSQGFKINKRIELEADYYHMVRSAMRRLDTDISLAFHAFTDTAVGRQRIRSLANINPDYEYRVISYFVGNRERVEFTSSSHGKMYRNSPETATCQIEYYLDTDIYDPGVQVFLKRETPFIDEHSDTIDRIAIKYRMIREVESVAFRFYTATGFDGRGRWVDSWDSTQGDRKNLFPDGVQIILEVKNPFFAERTDKFIQNIKLLNPNNLKPAVVGGQQQQ